MRIIIPLPVHWPTRSQAMSKEASAVLAATDRRHTARGAMLSAPRPVLGAKDEAASSIAWCQSLGNMRWEVFSAMLGHS